jgi:hypothetical protein
VYECRERKRKREVKREKARARSLAHDTSQEGRIFLATK